jgi:GrpB-like predicted nucleotidyltransferase (UPF0157 family)
MSADSIKIVSHRDEWRDKYEAEKAALSQALRRYDHTIEHIGSTGVDALDAKPIVDIAILVDSVERVPEIQNPLYALGYTYVGEYGLPGRHFFTKGDPREFHLHLVDRTTDHWNRWLRFREILKEDPAVRRRYQALKRALARKYRHEREKYTAGKTEFIDHVLGRA